MEVIINQDELRNGDGIYSLSEKHNMKNAMAATPVAKLMQIRKATIRESLSNFQGVEHRLKSIENSKCSIYQ
jgi:UDP-N-acetylmuramoylalanine--D-glutamate ligase